MFDFKKALGKKDEPSGETQSKFELALQEVDALSRQAKEHTLAAKVPEQGKFLKIGSHKVTGKELNETAAQMDNSIIQAKNVQIKTLRHVVQLYRALDALDAEHIAGILTALKAAETATDWARINDENIGKITSYLMQDDRVLAHKKEQETRIAALERKVKNAYFVAGGAVVVAFASLMLCLIICI